MARTFVGHEHLESAYSQRDQATSIDEFRQAIAVIIPLLTGTSLDLTALIVGKSRAQTAVIRKKFFAIQSGKILKSHTKSELRNRAKTSLQEEALILDEVLADSAEGGVVVVPRLKPMIEKKLGKKICLATAYNMLHRHNWRKISPDRIHPKGDMQVQDDWKKNSNESWMKWSKGSLAKRP